MHYYRKSIPLSVQNIVVITIFLLLRTLSKIVIPSSLSSVFPLLSIAQQQIIVVLSITLFSLPIPELEKIKELSLLCY